MAEANAALVPLKDEEVSAFLADYVALCRRHGMRIMITPEYTIVGRYDPAELETQLKRDERLIWKRTLNIV